MYSVIEEHRVLIQDSRMFMWNYTVIWTSFITMCIYYILYILLWK